jgi:hypothetical protein
METVNDAPRPEWGEQSSQIARFYRRARHATMYSFERSRTTKPQIST